MPAEELAWCVVGVELAEDESATVEEDDERVGASGFFRGVVPCGERPGGAIDDQIPHGACGSRWAVQHGELASVGVAGFGWREDPQRGAPRRSSSERPSCISGSRV
jgi:hypothetical protein